MAAREYSRAHDFYLQVHDLQPLTPHFHQFDIPQANPSAAPTYEMTAGAGAGCAEAAVGLVGNHAAQSPLAQTSQAQHDPRKRKSPLFGSERYEMSGCDAPLPALQPVPPLSAPASVSRKRKSSSSYFSGTGSTYDDDCDDSRSSRTFPDKKQNHSEIEKRRRDKMNTYITELSSMIPMCGAMARKLDKLTVLRMAVQHLRSVRGALAACPLSAHPRPGFLPEKELNSLILEAAHDSFLLVVGCDRGRLLYVSASVKRMLHYDQSELLGQSLFDILHPKDVAKVKEQLSSSDLSPRERLIDIKTMLPVKADVIAGATRLCPGARRSFFCRIKCKAPPDPNPAPDIKEETDSSPKLKKKQTEKKYCVVQCTGYLKSWAPAEMSEGAGGTEGGDEGDACSLSCLVAVGRALPDLAPESSASPRAPLTRPLQYVSRHATDGKFLFVDQRVTLALGFLPQELLGTSLYEYVGGAELGAVARTHKQALLRRDTLHTPPYSFRRKDGSLARIQTLFKPFRNPWTKDVECLVANNTVVTDEPSSQPQDPALGPLHMFKHTGSNDLSDVSEPDVEMQKLIDSQVESHKIGSAIADEVLRRPSDFSPELPTDLLHEAVFNQQWQLTANLYEQATLADNILGVDISGFNQVRNNVPLSAAGAARSPVSTEPAGAIPTVTLPTISPPLPPIGVDGNGEATMAVIMSLLEADAGLGGPVNFSGLPWPLP